MCKFLVFSSFCYKASCLTVAILLHYLFMAAFSWMLCEGMLLFIMIKFVFYHGFLKRKLFFVTFGWGRNLIYSLNTRDINHVRVMQDYLFPLLLHRLLYSMSNMELMIGKVKNIYSFIIQPLYYTHCIYRCWISEERGAIWGFVGPMLLIIMVIVYTYAVITLCKL